MAQRAEHLSRASLCFFSTTVIIFVCRDAWRKISALSCSARLHGKDRTTQGLSALDKCGKGGDWRHPPTNCACRAPENQQGTHLFCCWLGRMHFEMHDTLIDGQRLHPEANGYAKRLLTDLQALALVPEWAEQTTNDEEDLEDVF